MSIFKQMNDLYQAYGMFDEPMDREKLVFRFSLLVEEINELQQALRGEDSEEVVDALIDIIVVASGTLELLEVDGDKAWEEVLKANSSKERGVKSTRPDSGGFDLVKPPSWVSPNHTDNLGNLPEVFDESNNQR